MKRCPKCLLPHEDDTAAQLIDEDEILTTQLALDGETERSKNDLGRAWLGFGLRALGYCDECIVIKGSIIGAEVGVAALSSPPSPAQVEHAFVDGGAKVFELHRSRSVGWVRGIVRNGERISNHELFRGATDCVPSFNDDGMPKRGA